MTFVQASAQKIAFDFLRAFQINSTYISFDMYSYQRIRDTKKIHFALFEFQLIFAT